MKGKSSSMHKSPPHPGVAAKRVSQPPVKSPHAGHSAEGMYPKSSMTGHGK